MFNVWVKNVHSLGVSEGASCVFISPYSSPLSVSLLKTNGKVGVYSLTIQLFSSVFSTKKIVHFNLLNARLYLFSTAPTITKTIQKNLNHS